MLKSLLPKAFLLILVAFVLWACYLIFKPFLVELVAAAILASFFYRPYEWLVKKFAGRRKTAALVMCFLVVLIVIVPIVNLIILGAQRSMEGYSQLMNYINNNDIEAIVSSYLPTMDLVGFDLDSLKNLFLDMTRNLSNLLLDGATSFVKGTTGFIISLIMIVFTMFFFFVDGRDMLKMIMRWTPLPNKYDIEIFNKFRAVSYSTVISTFVTAIAQGLAGALGFIIVGLPAFFAGVFMAFFSLIPYVGTTIVWLPAAIYLLVTGQIWQGVFLIIWGALIVGTIDNLLRAYLIRGESRVHPIFIIFSILGGISLFGFWGVILGPLIISLAVTILHIYEMEYADVLEK